ncbi:mitochondrial NAD transporter [Macrolepiota fuliginosa MF-IS2]|uniref:Mitochondrial NAD transporter n=1 Tax=Macrolepiota fuliginosa MF-IS2 TaxID=1400762 RepID=A0A9P6C330_9AGAR|nr:mitochondrial NAD transporter [Macrolepiota fuliginosa MF-IS2]
MGGPPTRQQPKWTANSMIAGAGGGLVASIATCPLDVVKTKLQAQRAIQGHAEYLGIWGTVRSILVHDGFRGLYRGLGPTILGYLPTWAIYFSVYDFIKSAFGDAPLGSMESPADVKGDRIYPAPHVKGYQPVIREHPWSLHLLSAMTAGAASTCATNPLWVIKTRFMTQSRDEVRYRHTWDAAWTIYRTEGVAAFYRGLVPSLLGILHVAVQFPLYERLKILVGRDRRRPLTPQEILICSAVSKMTASIATYPHEVIRTRLQTQRRPLADDMSSDGMVKRYPSAERVANLDSNQARFVEDLRRVKRGGIIYTTRKLVQKEGWTGLYRGLSVNLVRTVPNSAVTMLTYELLMRHLNRGSPG